jgi:hypothetical protein
LSQDASGRRGSRGGIKGGGKDGAAALPRARKERRRPFIGGASCRGGARTSRHPQDRGMGARRRRRAACTAATTLGGRRGDVTVWRARGGRGRRWTRRPTPLRLPRGARGTSTSAPSPLREVHDVGARAERRQRAPCTAEFRWVVWNFGLLHFN